MASPNTIRVYTLDGSLNYPVEFDYLAQRFVVVTLIGSDRKELTQGSDYTFLSTNMIALSSALDTTGYTTIEVKRVTSTTERLVVFNDASILTATDLNLSDMQVIHIAEEGRDIASDSLGSDDDGNLDARGRRLVNLSDPVNDQDAVTKHYFDTAAAGVGVEAAAAAASAAAALVSQNAAAASQASALASSQAASTAKDVALAAGVSANDSKVAALASENKAKDWAIKMDGPVEATEYSSKYHATQAKTSEVNAKASEVAAAASASLIDPNHIVAKDSPTGGAVIPSGTTAQRPTPGTDHPIRYNSDLKTFEGAGEGGAWGGIGGGALGGGTDKVFYPSGTEVTQPFTLAATQNWMVPGRLKVSAKLTIEGRLVIV